jgi:hypothetical protein
MTSKELESDLSYVKDLIHKSDRRPSPSILYIMWAVIVAIGFTMADFAPNIVSWYWAIAGPLGGIASGIVGGRHQRVAGQLNRDLGIRHALHWGGMLVAIFLAVLLIPAEVIRGEDIGKVILLIVAFGWWSGGVHFDRVFMWLGLAMGLGFVAVLWVDRYAWTCLGTLIAVVLIMKGFAGPAKETTHES